MNTNISLPTIAKISSIILVAVVIMACQIGSFAAVTATPVPTNTLLPTSTSTPKPTLTKRPTLTLLPTSTTVPTPAAVGEPVLLDNNIEITVIDAFDRDRIYPGGEYLYTPKQGYILVDMGVQIRNLNPGKTVSVPWQQVYILEDNGDSWYPLWGSAKMVESGKTIDPFTIGISSNEVDGNELINIENDVYLRLIYIVQESNQQILFGIKDSPQIELTLHK
jgi:hypothetical protein